eukprot:scaffold24.g2986.t1
MGESVALQAHSRLPPGVRASLEQSQSSWLSNEQIHELLLHVEPCGFPTSRQAPHLPEAGTLYVFNKKTCRYFRKDGHPWELKQDNKTVNETHEKLKVGDKKKLNCYYCRSRMDDLKRRSYWLLEPPPGQPQYVLVHYLIAKGKGEGAASPGTAAATAPRQPRLRPTPRAAGSEEDTAEEESEEEEEEALRRWSVPHGSCPAAPAAPPTPPPPAFVHQPHVPVLPVVQLPMGAHMLPPVVQLPAMDPTQAHAHAQAQAQLPPHLLLLLNEQPSEQLPPHLLEPLVSLPPEQQHAVAAGAAAPHPLARVPGVQLGARGVAGAPAAQPPPQLPPLQQPQPAPEVGVSVARGPPAGQLRQGGGRQCWISRNLSLPPGYDVKSAAALPSLQQQLRTQPSQFDRLLDQGCRLLGGAGEAEAEVERAGRSAAMQRPQPGVMFMSGPLLAAQEEAAGEAAEAEAAMYAAWSAEGDADEVAAWRLHRARRGWAAPPPGAGAGAYAPPPGAGASEPSPSEAGSASRAHQLASLSFREQCERELRRPISLRVILLDDEAAALPGLNSTTPPGPSPGPSPAASSRSLLGSPRGGGAPVLFSPPRPAPSRGSSARGMLSRGSSGRALSTGTAGLVCFASLDAMDVGGMLASQLDADMHNIISAVPPDLPAVAKASSDIYSGPLFPGSAAPMFIAPAAAGPTAVWAPHPAPAGDGRGTPGLPPPHAAAAPASAPAPLSAHPSDSLTFAPSPADSGTSGGGLLGASSSGAQLAPAPAGPRGSFSFGTAGGGSSGGRGRGNSLSLSAHSAFFAAHPSHLLRASADAQADKRRGQAQRERQGAAAQAGQGARGERLAAARHNRTSPREAGTAPAPAVAQQEQQPPAQAAQQQQQQGAHRGESADVEMIQKNPFFSRLKSLIRGPWGVRRLNSSSSDAAAVEAGQQEQAACSLLREMSLA